MAATTAAAIGHRASPKVLFGLGLSVGSGVRPVTMAAECGANGAVQPSERTTGRRAGSDLTRGALCHGPDRKNNWLPAPAGSFSLFLRLYRARTARPHRRPDSADRRTGCLCQAISS